MITPVKEVLFEPLLPLFIISRSVEAGQSEGCVRTVPDICQCDSKHRTLASVSKSKKGSCQGTAARTVAAAYLWVG